MLRWICALCLVLASAHAAPLSYDMMVDIDPPASSMTVRGEMKVPVAPGAREIAFILHETFEVKELTVNGGKAAVSYQPVAPSAFTPAVRKVVVPLPKGVGRTVRLGISYGGKLKPIPEWGSFDGQKLAMDDQINARMVQLASYSAWYPQFGSFGRRLQSELTVKLPRGWTAVCSGAQLSARSDDGRAATRWSSPDDFDIVIVAAPNFRKTSAAIAGGKLEIYDTRLPESFVGREIAAQSATLAFFTDRLGKTVIPGGAVRHVYSPLLKGQGRAGIARTGMVITSEGRVLDELAKHPDYSLFQDIAHEIAHFWWHFGAGQGDWINEAFAEYFSALAVRQVKSQKAFDERLAFYRQMVASLPADAPALATVPADGSWWAVRYCKGSLMLDALRTAMGDAAFFQAARDFFQQYKGKAAGTADFRAFWAARLGAKKDMLSAWIDAGGGLPMQ